MNEINFSRSILNICNDLLEELNKQKVDSDKVKSMAQCLGQIKNIDEIRTQINKTLLRIINSTAQYILYEYIMQDDSKKIDYKAQAVFVQFLVKVIFDGIPEKNISLVTFKVKFDDVLYDYNIEYDDEEIIIEDQYLVFWMQKDKLYQYYSIFSRDYIGFDDYVIRSLATEAERYDKLIKRKQGQELVSYNGVIGGLIFNIEHELKKIVKAYCPKFDVLHKELKDTLNEFKSIDTDSQIIDILKEKYIDKIDVLRDTIRNPIGHANRGISKEEAKEAHKFLLHSDLLQQISNAIMESIK